MKISFIILFTCSLFVTVSGQVNKVTNVPILINGDTTIWYKHHQVKVDRLKLANLLSNKDYLHFRFWTNGQIVDIWTNESKIFYGTLTNYINNYINKQNNSKKINKKAAAIYSNQVQLDSSLARETFELFKTISTIPSEDSINGWVRGFDGIEYLIEISNPYFYSFKTYWTPKAQNDSLIEAKLIQEFADKIRLTISLKEEYNKFFSTLKPGSYTVDGMMICTKITQKQEKRIIKNQPYKDYLDTIRDTLDKYLTDTITKLFSVNNYTLPQYHNFYLKLSPKNKLIKIVTDEKEFGFKEKKEFHKLKKNIVRTFRKIEIGFVHSKVSYWLIIENINNKIRIL